MSQHCNEERPILSEPPLQHPRHHHLTWRFLNQHGLGHIPVPSPFSIQLVTVGFCSVCAVELNTEPIDVLVDIGVDRLHELPYSEKLYLISLS